jgi:RimJ/RimL family protein N-acetyltransferase
VLALDLTSTALAARRLYVRSGFVLVGTLKGAMKDGARYIDEDLMVLQL